MYFTISFDIKSAEAENQYVEFIKDCIDNQDWVRPVSGSFVVQCDDESFRIGVREKLLNYIEEHSDKKPMFIISPLIDTGQMTGATTSNIVKPLGEITHSPFAKGILESR